MRASFDREAFISAPLALRLARLRRAAGSSVSADEHPSSFVPSWYVTRSRITSPEED